MRVRLLAFIEMGLALAFAPAAWGDGQIPSASTEGAAERVPGGGVDDLAANQVRAEELFKRGLRAFDAKRYLEAASFFADSQKLDPATGTMLCLASCYQRLGKTASAWAEFLAAAAFARDLGQVAWAKEALDQAALLEARLPLAVVRVTAAADGAAPDVRLDRTLLTANLWGQPMPVDAGQHDLEATAPGKQRWSTRFEVDETHLATVVVPRLEPVEEAALKPLQSLAVVLGGTGIAGLGAAGIVSLVAKMTSDGADCPAPHHCTPAGMSARSRAIAEADVATGAAAAGGGLLIAGAVLWFAAPAHPRSVRVGLSTAPLGWGARVEGDW